MPSRTLRGPTRTHAPRHGARIGGAVAAAAASAGLLAVSAAPAGATTTSQVAKMPELSQGAHGVAVKQLQSELHLDRTGRYTAHTRTMVEHFQARHHLSVDGIVGPETRSAILGVKPPSATSEVADTAGASSAGEGDYTVPSSIVDCESGGDYGAVNPSSGAGGAYQILPSTWAAYGGSGLPQDASPAEQNAIAAKIYASQGASAWSCG